MALIQFNDLPNTDTPINANNLNNNFNEVSQKNYILIRMSENFNVTTSEQVTLLPFNIVKNSEGNKLTLNNGQIIVGQGVSKIKISGSITNLISSEGQRPYYVQKNGITDLFFNSGSGGSNTYVQAIISEWVIDVIQGDVITISYYSTNGDSICETRSYLYVEAIK